LARTNENYLRWKFGHWVAKGYTPNVTLFAAGNETGVAQEPGESAIAGPDKRDNPELNW
jgi:hypothetical protein